MRRWVILLLSVLAFSLLNCRQTPLETGFVHPPDTVKPWVYWYWFSDNISASGISKDLAAMAKIGIGTALIGNVSDGGERGEVKALSDQWWQLVQHAIREAGKYNIDIGLFNCPGWSQSGGPWIQPEQAMRYLVTDEISVTGPLAFSQKLTKPAENYQDVAVLAFPKKTGTHWRSGATTTIRSAPTADNLNALFDGDRATVVPVPESALLADRLTVDLKSQAPFTASSLAIYPAPVQFSATCELQSKNDRGDFTTIRKGTLYRAPETIDVGPMFNAPLQMAFPAVTSDHFRVIFTEFTFHPFMGKFTGAPGLAEIELSDAARLDHYIEKQLGKMFWMPLPMWHDYLWDKSQEPELSGLTIPQAEIIDLSQALDAEGVLKWQVPAGDWTLVRVGMIPTGTKNSPVLPEGQGLEVDKLNRQWVEHHFNAYIGKVLREMPAAERKALKYVVIDSYEKGSQNWTDGMRAAFIETYGYDPIKWLPALTGRIVESAEQSDRFLWDLRRMVADRVSFEYAAGLRHMANKNGLKLWMENYGHWGFPGEFLQYGGQSDIVSGEFWATGDLGSIELKAAASAAHIYGQRLVCSESFTSGPPNFIYHPWAFKKRGDWSFAEGINQTLLHVYLHQPYDDRIPGVNAFFGSAFNRHNTWFFKINSWLSYLKRCNYLLQQGQFVADVAYFIGEDVPKMTGIRQPELPAGYAYDYINADVIMKRLKVRDGRFVLPDGMSYRVLVLPELPTMRPELLDKIRQLVADGGVIYGPAPERSPSRQNFPDCDARVVALASALWQDCDGQKVKQVRYGKGQVFYGMTLQTVLDLLDLPADVGGEDLTDVLWIHRQVGTADLYFVTNQSDQAIQIAPIFRVNKAPELWNAVTGEMIKTACYSIAPHGVKTTLVLNPRESVFVVFRQPLDQVKSVLEVLRDHSRYPFANPALEAGQVRLNLRENGIYTVVYQDGSSGSVTVADLPPAMELTGPWELRFAPGMDVPEQVVLDTLKSWTEMESEGMRYYSGTAAYRKNFVVSEAMVQPDQRVILALGQVGVIAEVSVNGKALGDFWQPPFEIDITDAVQVGDNVLEVQVTNVWRNRLIGDARYPDGFPSANGKPRQFKSDLLTDISIKGDEELIPSGLMGPVRLLVVKRISLQGPAAPRSGRK